MDEQQLDWTRLADYVHARRRSQGLRSRAAFAVKAGVSQRTLGDLERGAPVGKGTLLAVDSALMWVAGSCERILQGGEPILWPQHAPGFWTDDPAGDSTVSEENPQPPVESDGSPVGPADDGAEYVAHPGPEGETSDPVTARELLEEIRRVARDVEDIKRRLDGA